MSNRIVGDVAAIQSNGLAIEDVGERLVGGSRIAERTRRQGKCGNEILVQLAVDTETHADTGAIAVGDAVLVEGLASDTDVSAKPKPSCERFQGRQLPTGILLLRADRRQFRLRVRGVARGLLSDLLCIRRRLLSLYSGRLGLIDAILRLLCRRVSLLGRVQQLLNLRLQPLD